jgi:HK97 family phage portal protein
MDVKTVSLNPKDAQLLESRAFSVEEICRWFRVDPSMIGHGNAVSNWGTGLEQKMIGFLTFTLRPILTRIEQAINNELIPLEDRGIYYAEFSIDGLLRGDSSSRATFFREMVNAGIMTRDEVRKLENLPPLGGNAEKLMTNGATQPIDTLQGLN